MQHYEQWIFLLAKILWSFTILARWMPQCIAIIFSDNLNALTSSLTLDNAMWHLWDCLTMAFSSLSPVSCAKPQCNPFIIIERYASTLSSLLLTADLWTLPVGKWALHDITRRSQLLGSFTAHYYMGDNACYIIQLTEACAPWVEESVKCAVVYTLGIHYETHIATLWGDFTYLHALSVLF